MPPEDPIDNWKAYYKKTGARQPRETLLYALENFENEQANNEQTLKAIDLGCGNGRDTVELLRRGWQVLAVDSQQSAIDGLLSRQEVDENVLLETMTSRFEQITLPESDLINASFSLPLVSPLDFPDLWDRMLMSLAPGGRISCQLYGDRDSWVGDPSITFFAHSAIDALLYPLDTEYFREEEEDSETPRGSQKHWHIYHLVVRRPY
jgi:trans-aconitate methyltransferase